MKSKGGVQDFSFHNLPCGPEGFICGAVSNEFRVEDYVKKACIGAFMKSSHTNPQVKKAGTLLLPERFHVTALDDKMHGVDMFTRLPHCPGMEPTWPYRWADGSGRPLLTPEEITKHQLGENNPCPSRSSKQFAMQERKF